MGKHLSQFILLGLLALGIFGLLFKLLQNEQIYHETLGEVSRNYVRTGGWYDYEIKQEAIPYVALTNESILSWDAPIYQCLAEHMYRIDEGCYREVRSAFFPLFPLLWKTTHSTPIGIALINYLLFILSVSLLAVHLVKHDVPGQIPAFLLLVTLPTTIIFHIPYSEALFLFTMTVAVLGLLRGSYRLYFIGMLLTAMVRPATVFVLLAFLAADAFALLRGAGFRSFLRNAASHALPFLVGYAVVFLLQYLYSGSWTIMLDAQAHWEGGIQRFKAISDWSIEGFGMNSFAIFFVALPAVAFVLFSLFRSRKGQAPAPQRAVQDHLLLVSSIYLAGLLLFTLITSGGNLHGFFRFTMATPLFYIAALILLDRLQEFRPTTIAIALVVPVALLYIFLLSVGYGGERSQFAYLGLYLLVASFLLLGLGRKLPKLARIPLYAVVVFGNILWNTFLFNVFLSNGWIFT